MNITEAVQDYIDYLGEQNRSQSTSATYRYALERFLRFLEQEEESRSPAPSLRSPRSTCGVSACTSTASS